MKTQFDQFLTAKQQRFCDEYFIDLNATAAALRAGYSRETALNGALMRMPKIKLYIQQHSEAIAGQVNVKHDDILRELCKIAFGNLGNYFADDGSLKPMNALSSDAKAALWSVSVTDAGSGVKVVGDNTNNGRQGETRGVLKLRMYNKLTALDKIAKHTGFYKPELKEPEVINHYLNPDELTADDRFDDEELKDELNGIKKQETRLRKQEEAKAKREADRAKREEEAKRTDGFMTKEEFHAGYDPNCPLDEDGNVLCDGAGIPYGPLPKVAVATEPEEPVVKEPAPVATPPVQPVAPLYGKLITKEQAAERAKERWLRENPPRYLVY